jgi:hypothetical protein
MSLPRAAYDPAPLEAFADCAGRALACVFSCSDEYEAALIAERRAEGRYGNPRRKRLVMAAAVTGGFAALALLLI